MRFSAWGLVCLLACGLGISPARGFDRIQGLVPPPVLRACLDYPMRGALPKPGVMARHGFHPAARFTEAVRAPSYRLRLGSNLYDRVNGRGITVSFAPKTASCVMTLNLPAAGSRGVLTWLEDQLIQAGYPRLPLGGPSRRIYHAGSVRLQVLGKQFGGAAVLRIQAVQ